MKFLDYFAAFVRRNILDDTRVENLSKVFISFIKKKRIKILDFGSGYDGKLILHLSKKLKKLNYDYQIHCYDFYNNKFIEEKNRIHKNIHFFHLKKLDEKKFIKYQKYDYVIISDVIHHIGVNKFNKNKKIFNKLAKISNNIIIKDHFSENFFQTQILRFIDFIGNRGTGTNIPKKYFSKKTFQKFLEFNNLIIVKKKYPLVVRPKYFFFFSNPKLHFACLLKNYK